MFREEEIKMKLPIKLRVMDYAIHKDGSFSAEEAAREIGHEYPGEKTVSVKNIEKIIRVYCGIGMLKASDIDLDAEDNLKIAYEVTSAGRACESMIP